MTDNINTNTLKLAYSGDASLSSSPSETSENTLIGVVNSLESMATLVEIGVNKVKKVLQGQDSYVRYLESLVAGLATENNQLKALLEQQQQPAPTPPTDATEPDTDQTPVPSPDDPGTEPDQHPDNDSNQLTTNVELTSNGFLLNGSVKDVVISDEHWVGSIRNYGVHANNGVHLESVCIYKSVLFSNSYGAYLPSVNDFQIYESTINAGGGNDGYAIRALTNTFFATDSSFLNPLSDKACVRLVKANEARILRCGFCGGRIMLGGGAADEKENQQECKHGYMIDSQIQFTGSGNDALVIFERTHDWQFRNVKFILKQGSRVGTIWDGARNIRFIKCKVSYDNGNTFRLMQWSDLKDGDRLKSQSEQRQIFINADTD